MRKKPVGFHHADDDVVENQTDATYGLLQNVLDRHHEFVFIANKMFCTTDARTRSLSFIKERSNALVHESTEKTTSTSLFTLMRFGNLYSP